MSLLVICISFFSNFLTLPQLVKENSVYELSRKQQFQYSLAGEKKHFLEFIQLSFYLFAWRREAYLIIPGIRLRVPLRARTVYLTPHGTLRLPLPIPAAQLSKETDY